jgi:hypothetical protein
MGAWRRTGRASVGTASVATPSVRRSPSEQQEIEPAEPAFHRAILKIALELRKHNAKSYDAVVEDTITAMRIDGPRFRRYLGQNGARNMSLLLATAKAFGL